MALKQAKKGMKKGEVKKACIDLKEDFAAGAAAYDEMLKNNPQLRMEIEAENRMLRDKEDAKRKEEYEREKSKIRKSFRKNPFHVLRISLNGSLCQFPIKQRCKDGIIIPGIHHMGTPFSTQGIVPFSGPHLVSSA